METSIFIAQILAITYLSLGVGLLFSGGYYKKAFPKLMENSGFMLLGGVSSLVIGFLMVNHHNFWNNDWTVVITVFGWLALTKGVALLAFPTSFDVFKPMFKSGVLYKFLIPGVFVFGGFFGYFGFFA